MKFLDNDYLQVEIKEKGAELTRVFSKKTKLDYLWGGNSEFWQRQSPVLFPFVGRLKDNTYFVDGKSYQLSQHGFARDCMFKHIEKTETKSVFELCFSEETLKKYPYKFKLRISYKLDKNKLIVTYEVVNVDDKIIYFSIGGHPAFKCPLVANTSFTDYYIEFGSKENVRQLFLNNQTGLIEPNEIINAELTKIPLNYDLFEKDALIFEKIQSDLVSLKSEKHSHGISMTAENWDFFAFWTKKNAPFICFEPWQGIADFSDTNQNFEEKKGIKKLTVDETYKVSYSVMFF